MSGSTPLVSVIMIFLNAEQFIQEAIESVFAQTYGHWELVLVDDGSTDASSAIARGHAQRHPDHVRYCQHEGHQNRGMSASRNLGIREARGNFIAFLDADDVYLPLKLEQQVALLEAYPAAAMVYGATQHWYSWTGRAEDRDRDKLRALGVPPDALVQPPTLPDLYLRGQAQTPGICGLLVRREALDRSGGFDERFRGMFEDQVFIYKLCLSQPVFVASRCWDRYRQHPDSWSRVAHGTGEYDRVAPNEAHRAFLTWLESYLVQQGMTDPSVWQALGWALWPYRHPCLYGLFSLARRAVHRPKGWLTHLYANRVWKIEHDGRQGYNRTT